MCSIGDPTRVAAGCARPCYSQPREGGGWEGWPYNSQGREGREGGGSPANIHQDYQTNGQKRCELWLLAWWLQEIQVLFPAAIWKALESVG